MIKKKYLKNIYFYKRDLWISILGEKINNAHSLMDISMKFGFDETKKYISENLRSSQTNIRIKSAIFSILQHYITKYEVLPSLMLKSQDKNNLLKNAFFAKPSIKKYSVKNEIKYLHLPSRYSFFLIPFRFIYSIYRNIIDIKKRQKTSYIDVLASYKKEAGSHFQKITKSIFGQKGKLKVLHYNEKDYIFRPWKVSKEKYKQFLHDLKKFDNILTFGFKFILLLEFLKLQSLLEFYRPHLIFCFNEHSKMQGLLSYVAQLNGILIVNMAHAFSRGEIRANSPYDYHIVFGKASKNEILKMNGYIDGEIIPIGAPNTDELFKFAQTRKADISLTPPKKLKNILVFSTYVFKKESINFLLNIFSVLKKFSIQYPEYQLMIKKHPNSYRFPHLKNLEENYFIGSKNIKILALDISSVDAIKSCDLGITIGLSNAGFEIAILGKPLTILDPRKIPDLLGYYKYNYALRAKDFESLCLAIRKIESGDHDYTFGIKKMLNYYYSNQGYAGEAIYEFILNLLKGPYSSKNCFINKKIKSNASFYI